MCKNFCIGTYFTLMKNAYFFYYKNKKMNRNTRLLLIGGAVRNVGKTTLTAKIIKKFSQNNNIIAVKIKTIREAETKYHGKNRNPLIENEKYRITQITTADNNSDSGKMLNAGAKYAFKIKTKSEFIDLAFAEMMKSVSNKNNLIVCESNSLREYIEPAIFLLILKKDSNEMKISAKKLKHLADKIILSDGKHHDFDAEQLYVKNNVWKLRNDTIIQCFNDTIM